MIDPLNEFSPNLSYEPYWWNEAPPPPAHADDPPATADVVVIGTGFTGVNAALTLSRAGRHVVGLDAGAVGFGASTRNGGQIGPGNQKFRVDDLINLFGREQAHRIYREGNEMLAYFKELVRVEAIECDLCECGRFRGAVTAGHYEAIARELEAAKRFAGVEGFVVERSDTHREVQSDAYVGGVVLSEDGSVHPGRLHAGLLERAQQAGASFFGDTRVLGYQGVRNGFTVATSRGSISARDLIVATNGYTTGLAPFFSNKIVPVGSGIIATAPLGAERITALLPRQRVYGETRRVFSYYRPSPDGTRLLFGGRCFKPHHDAQSAYRYIHRAMVRVFPELKGIPITHAWSGCVGMSRDELPHIGVDRGVHYAMGYSGTGVTRAAYFGHKVALRLLGNCDGQTAFDDVPFTDHSALARMPSAVNAYIRWMALKDAIDGLRLPARSA